MTKCLFQERKLYGARLENLKQSINQDIYDLEVCHDVMVKGHILAQDAASSLDETSTVSPVCDNNYL